MLFAPIARVVLPGSVSVLLVLNIRSSIVASDIVAAFCALNQAFQKINLLASDSLMSAPKSLSSLPGFRRNNGKLRVFYRDHFCKGILLAPLLRAFVVIDQDPFI